MIIYFCIIGFVLGLVVAECEFPRETIAVKAMMGVAGAVMCLAFWLFPLKS